MDKIFKTQTLLPWLDPFFSKIYLDISLQSNSLKANGKSDFPFRLLDSSSPLFNLIHASYRTSSSRIEKEVFLQVQKDCCSFINRNTPFNNPEIDKLWQGSLKPYDAGDGRFSFNSFSGSSTNLLSSPLWQSLFYCGRRKCYFHPPCPHCGIPLDLCRQDEILFVAELPLYSTTLERFLFCPDCHSKQSGSDFFNNHSGDTYPMAKNFRALVAGFEQLLKKGMAGDDFPCRSCEEQNDCYGSGHAFHLISPFAFYPFRMLISDAGQLPAKDFISMLSGASCEELKKQPCMVRNPGKSACLESFQQQERKGIQLFLVDDARSFLEIIYLKIALLEQIQKIAFVAKKYLPHPDLRLSVDQFWVDLPDFQGILPYFWNFKIRPFALGIFPVEKVSFVRVPESLSLYSLAELWFNVLLVNSEQSEGDVQHALATLLEKDTSFENEQDFLDSSLDVKGIFKPGNTFWFPIDKQLPRLWLDLWQQCLRLGWSLLQASFQSTVFLDDVFAGQVKQLADDVKKTLFVSKDSPVEAQNKVDFAILQILLSLKEKWQEDSAAIPKCVAFQAEQNTDIIDPVPEKSVAAHGEEQLEKTVILNADHLAALFERVDRSHQKEGAKETIGTVAGNECEAEGDLEKTVIINVNDLEKMLLGNKEPGTGSAQDENIVSPPDKIVEDQLSETVIINSELLEKLRKGKNGNK